MSDLILFWWNHNRVPLLKPYQELCNDGSIRNNLNLTMRVDTTQLVAAVKSMKEAMQCFADGLNKLNVKVSKTSVSPNKP